MAKRDLEARIIEVADVVQTNLNSKIAAINSEKNDGVEMATVASGAYVYQDLGFSTPNYDPTVFINAQVELGDTVGNEVKEVGRITVEIVASDRGYAGSDKVLKLLARYRRALREVLLDNWQKLQNPKVTYLPDGRFSAPEGPDLYSVAVQVEFTHAS